jgi:hypothetical protein
MRLLFTILAITITALIMWGFRSTFYWFMDGQSTEFLKGYVAGALTIVAGFALVMWYEKRTQRR